MAFGVLVTHVVHVAGRHHRATGLRGESAQVLVDALLALDAGVLKLEVHVVRPKDLAKRVELLPCAREVLVGKSRADGA